MPNIIQIIVAKKKSKSVRLKILSLSCQMQFGVMHMSMNKISRVNNILIQKF